jgi:hypothetical protein
MVCSSLLTGTLRVQVAIQQQGRQRSSGTQNSKPAKAVVTNVESVQTSGVT